MSSAPAPPPRARGGAGDERALWAWLLGALARCANAGLEFSKKIAGATPAVESSASAHDGEEEEPTRDGVSAGARGVRGSVPGECAVHLARVQCLASWTLTSYDPNCDDATTTTTTSATRPRTPETTPRTRTWTTTSTATRSTATTRTTRAGRFEGRRSRLSPRLPARRVMRRSKTLRKSRPDARASAARARGERQAGRVRGARGHRSDLRRARGIVGGGRAGVCSANRPRGDSNGSWTEPHGAKVKTAALRLTAKPRRRSPGSLESSLQTLVTALANELAPNGDGPRLGEALTKVEALALAKLVFSWCGGQPTDPAFVDSLAPHIFAAAGISTTRWPRRRCARARSCPSWNATRGGTRRRGGGGVVAGGRDGPGPGGEGRRHLVRRYVRGEAR